MGSRRAVALLAAVLATAAAVAGCGSSSAGSTAGANRLLADTFSAGGTHVHSGNLTIALDVRATGFPTFKGPLAVRLSGPFDSGKKGTPPKFDFDLDFTGPGSKIAAGAVSTGTHGYLKLGGHAYVVPQSSFRRLGSGVSNKGAGITLKSLGIDPRHWVKDVRTVGEADLGGTRTVHLSAGIDPPRLLKDLGAVFGTAGAFGLGTNAQGGLDAATRDKIAHSIDHAHVDIWTGKSDHVLRRLALDVRFDVPAKLRPKGTSVQNGELRLDLTLAGVNQPQPIGPPANPLPLSDLTTALQQLAAQAQGGAAQPQGSAGSPPSGSGSKYDACIAKAGNDLAAIQRCSSLLGQ
jgi:hypothetical protein